MENSVPVKSEVVITIGKVRQADNTPNFQDEDERTARPYELKGKLLEPIYHTVFDYDSKSTLYLTVCDNVAIDDNHVLECVTSALLIVSLIALFDCYGTVTPTISKQIK